MVIDHTPAPLQGAVQIGAGPRQLTNEAEVPHPNGAGKSTLFQAVFGLLLPVMSGPIEPDGRSTSCVSPRQMIDAAACDVPQGRNIFPELSVLHNLELGGAALQSLLAARLLACCPALRAPRRSLAAAGPGGLRHPQGPAGAGRHHSLDRAERQAGAAGLGLWPGPGEGRTRIEDAASGFLAEEPIAQLFVGGGLKEQVEESE